MVLTIVDQLAESRRLLELAKQGRDRNYAERNAAFEKLQDVERQIRLQTERNERRLRELHQLKRVLEKHAKTDDELLDLEVINNLIANHVP